MASIQSVGIIGGVAGLYQCGQTTYPGYSVARSAMSGILAAEALLAD